MFFKRKPLIVDMYTYAPHAYELAKPQLSHKFYPEWWRSLEKQHDTHTLYSPMPTAKMCAGIIEQYAHGFVLPLWSDVNVLVGPNYVEYAFADRVSTAVSHPPFQRGTYLPEQEFAHLKIDTPWAFKCEDDTPFVCLGPTWNYDAPHEFLIPPATVNFKYQHGANVNMFFTRAEQPKKLTLHHGQPLLQFIPLTDRKLQVRHHLLTNDEYHKLCGMHATPPVFVGVYNKIKAIKKNEAKCPFRLDAR